MSYVNEQQRSPQRLQFIDFEANRLRKFIYHIAKAGKVWGATELIHANGALEFHRINFNAGYKCSEHAHEFKWNGFFVESGKMIVRVWQDDQGLVDETILEAGDFTQVKPGKIHQFEGLEDGVAFELYWAEFNHDDIVRRTSGTEVERKK